MGYASILDVQRVIAQALTSATSATLDSPVDLINIGRILDKNLVTEDIVNSYIRYADSQINGRISSLYKVPMCETADFEGALFSPVTDDSSGSIIVLDETCPLSVGDIIILSEDTNQEKHIIEEIISEDTFKTEDFVSFGFGVGARVLRVKFPDPLIIMSARLAAANIYDKYFSAESSPNTSEFGKELRELAFEDINKVLRGVIIFHGQHRIGRRFYNSNLVDQYGLPNIENMGE